MSIFNRTSLMESINNMESYDAYIEPTMESVAEINAELNETTYKLTTSLYVADLLLEQRAQAGEDVEALMEATGDGFFKNMIRGIKTAWDKIKTFFRNLLKKVKEFITGGKSFIDKYEKFILKKVDGKNVKWVEYYDHYDANKIIDFVEKTPEVITTIIDEFKKDPIDEEAVDSITKNGLTFEDGLEFKVASTISSEHPTYTMAKLRIDELADAKTDEIMQYRREKHTLDKATAIEMVNIVKKYNNNGVREINDKVKILNKMYSECITNINKFADSYRDPDTEYDSIKQGRRKLFMDKCTRAREAISFAQYVATHVSSVYSNLYRHSVSVLKEFVSANGLFK